MSDLEDKRLSVLRGERSKAPVIVEGSNVVGKPVRELGELVFVMTGLYQFTIAEVKLYQVRPLLIRAGVEVSYWK